MNRRKQFRAVATRLTARRALPGDDLCGRPLHLVRYSPDRTRGDPRTTPRQTASVTNQVLCCCLLSSSPALYEEGPDGKGGRVGLWR
jgi:hypothetical protein